ncbi:catalase [Sphingobacterium psychroaquaticum]|uniref:catalase n=1 Tax=Sphingobacterium psychroaquaticum TaxID=561061 RepID=A0A1X7JD42_9SPHI|nr:catalase [Sphingobacterium psychroaquaticum]QBQ39891.1 catalase [Sphingobacterium psychroaquaticum]SMG25603.1 catalase [Sphingobacterium psychroaquaticum]
MGENNKKITTSSGAPMPHYEDSLSAGPRGQLLLQDYFLHEKLAQFNRERIPERIVHAKGSGAYGKFTVTNDISKYTRAKFLNKVGKETKVFMRFSTVGGERGSADSERDPRGFAMKFYTEDGNYDLVGNNTPVFFIKDPRKFPDFIHTQKRDPYTNCKFPTMVWDFWSLNPESLHQVTILMSNRGTPYGFRHMHGYGSHTFSMINKDNERVYVKFHFRTEQGIRNLTGKEAMEMRGIDPDYAQRDLYTTIEKGDFPKWKLHIQVMTEEQTKTFRWNPFDLTKVWSQKEYPLIEVGILELNENPANYFADVEQAAFAPAHVVDGISFSPDKMLQGRILSYPDAHRYRLGTNFEQIPVNRCPFMVNNYHRDGYMRVDGNGGSLPNYHPNSFDGFVADQSYVEPPLKLDSLVADHYDRNNNDDDHFTQPGDLYRLLDANEKEHLVNNIVDNMSGVDGPKKDEIIMRQLCHWFRADTNLGMSVAKGLGLSMDKLSEHMPK